jgi:5-methylcytosine-specific restriction enzyme subunit McrC
MLRTLRNSPFRSIDQSHLHACRMPLIEIFITVFLCEMEKLRKMGIQHFYIAQGENQIFLKGKLQFSENLKYNNTHRERFFVQFDEFKTDIPQNRILKTVLVYLQKESHSAKNIRNINSMLQLFKEVPICPNKSNDFLQINNQNRLFLHYKMVLLWAKFFSPDSRSPAIKENM